MKDFAVIQCFPDERISPSIPLHGCFRSAEQQVHGERRRCQLQHGEPLLKRAPLKRHHHQDVCVGIPARLTPGLRPKQDHLLRREMIHQSVGEGQQGLTGHQRAGCGCHGAIIVRLAGFSRKRYLLEPGPSGLDLGGLEPFQQHVVAERGLVFQAWCTPWRDRCRLMSPLNPRQPDPRRRQSRHRPRTHLQHWRLALIPHLRDVEFMRLLLNEGACQSSSCLLCMT